MTTVLVPNFMLVGHASAVVYAAKNTIRMAALTGRIRYQNLPWGMFVNTKDLAHHYVLKVGYTKDNQGNIVYTPTKLEE